MRRFGDLERMLRNNNAPRDNNTASSPGINDSREAALVGRLAVESCLVVDLKKAQNMFGQSFDSFWDSYAQYDAELIGVSLSTMDFSVFKETGKHNIERKDLFSRGFGAYLEHHIEIGSIAEKEFICLGKYVSLLDSSFRQVIINMVQKYAEVTFGKPTLSEEQMRQEQEKDVRYKKMEEQYLRAWCSGPRYESLRRKFTPEISSLYRKKEADNHEAMRTALGKLTDKNGAELPAFEQRVYNAMNGIVHWQYYDLAKALKTL